MTLSSEDRDLVVGALDTLGIALTTYGHQWSIGERCVYERAFEILTGNKDLPRGQLFEKEPDAGEEWKG